MKIINIDNVVDKGEVVTFDVEYKFLWWTKKKNIAINELRMFNCRSVLSESNKLFHNDNEIQLYALIHSIEAITNKDWYMGRE